MDKGTLIIACLVFLTIITAHSQDFDEKLMDAKLAIMEGNYESGLNICNELIATKNDDSTHLAEAFATAGLACEGLKHTTDALNYYSKAVELNIPQLDIYDKLIGLSKNEKNDSIYEFALIEKLKAFPIFEESITKNLNNHYAKIKDYEKLLTTSNKLISWYPSTTRYLFYKALALQNVGQIEESRTYYQKVLELEPEHPGANMSIGLMLYNKGREIFSQEKKEYEAIAKPDRVDYAVYNRGREKGKVFFREASPYLIKAYESGSYPDLKRVLFNLYVLSEEKEKAEPYR